MSEFAFSEHLLILGVDPSVRKTACVLRTAGGVTWQDLLITTERPRKEPQLTDPGRLEYIGALARRFVESCATGAWRSDGCQLLLCIESPATQAGHAAINQALHWTIRLSLATYYDVRTLVVAPTALRKFIAGDGRADKGTCGASAQRHWGEIIDGFANGCQEDVLDALGLAKLAECWLWNGIGSRTQYQQDVALMQNAKTKREVVQDGASVALANELIRKQGGGSGEAD